MSLNFTGKLFFASIFSIASALSYAQPRAEYYTSSTLDGKRGSELELALKAIVYPHTKIKYDHLWEAYETTDPGPSPDSIPSSYHGEKTDLVYDMYAWMSQFPKFYSDNDHSQTGGFNREHAVPNSWWGGESGNDVAYTDLHHLVPGDGAANNAKQNYPLGEYKSGMTLVWPTETKTDKNGRVYVFADTHDHSKMPCRVNASHVWKTTNTSDYDGVEYFFEPADEYKGDFARMYFYVVCAYEGIDWKVNGMFTTVSGHTTIKPWALDMLIKWHNADKVSKKERDRNNAVESLQGNRNPFIDYPELVDYIWGSKSSEAFCLSNATSSYSEEYSTRPSAKWALGGEYVSSVTAMLGEDFTSPTLEVDAKMVCTTQYTSSDESVATIDADGVVTINALGTTTITATVTPVEPSIPAAIATYILTVEKPVDPACYFAESFDGCKGSGGNDDEWSGSIAQNNVNTDVAGWTITKGFGANHCIKIGTGGEAGSATTPEIYFTDDAIITFKAGAWNRDGEATDINISTTNGTLSESSVTLTKGAWTDYRLYITGVTGSTKITFAGNGGNNRFFLDEVNVTAGYVRDANTANIGTICLSRAFEKPETMTLYNIVGKDADKIYFAENTEDIVAGRPYLFRSTETPIVITCTGETAAAGSNNGLVGTLNGCPITPNAGNYVLSNNQLYIVDGDFSCGANRAYIHLDGISMTSAKADFALEFEDPSGIEEVHAALNPQSSTINLQGVRVNGNYKGIVIVNGIKYLNK